jgi:hypothetical protein
MNRALPQLNTAQRYKQLLHNVPQVYTAYSMFYSNITSVAPLSLLLFIYQENFPLVHVGEHTGTNIFSLDDGSIQWTELRWLYTVVDTLSNKSNSELKYYTYMPT